METARMLEAGIGRFQGPNLMARLLAELADLWAPLAVALAAIATLPSLLRRLQVVLLRLRSRGKSVISSHISTYSFSDDDDYSDVDYSSDSDDDDEATNSDQEDSEEEEVRRVGYYGGGQGQDGNFAWGGAVVRTWQERGLGFKPFRPFSGDVSGEISAVRLWDARTASGAAMAAEAVLRRRAAAAATATSEEWWDADDGEVGGRRRAAAVPPVVVGWYRDVARRFPILPSPK